MSPASDAATAALAARYDAIAYAAQAHVLTHPERMAAIAHLCGLEPARVARCRVLELGCSDGTNLLPMAAALPQATFVGCDIAASAIAEARAAAGELGLANVTLIEGDLAALPADLAAFDYIVAHGMYSWVPAPVRDALLALAGARLAPHGVLFLSYNTWPGCRVRQAAWDVLRRHTGSLASPRERIDAARAFARLLAESATAEGEQDALLRAEFGRLAERTDSALFHDDLATINDPVFFDEIVAHATRHGLQFLAEAKPALQTTLGLAADVRHELERRSRLEREQYLDYVRFRRFRQSLFCLTDAGMVGLPLPARLAGLSFSAATALVRAAAERKAIMAGHTAGQVDPAGARAVLHALVREAPAALAFARLREVHDAALAPGATPRRSFEQFMLDLAQADAVDLHAAPVPVAREPGPSPVASAVARREARRGERVTNLRHESIVLKDPAARALLASLDGTRTTEAILAAMGTPDAQARARALLQQFGRHALLAA